MPTPNPRCRHCLGSGEREHWWHDQANGLTHIDYIPCDCASPEVERDYREEREQGWANGKT